MFPKNARFVSGIRRLHFTQRFTTPSPLELKADESYAKTCTPHTHTQDRRRPGATHHGKSPPWTHPKDGTPDEENRTSDIPYSRRLHPNRVKLSIRASRLVLTHQAELAAPTDLHRRLNLPALHTNRHQDSLSRISRCTTHIRYASRNSTRIARRNRRPSNVNQYPKNNPAFRFTTASPRLSPVDASSRHGRKTWAHQA